MPDIRARTSVWKGLNRAPYIADGEMRNMKNLCSDAYPYLTTRKGRKPYKFDIYIPSPEGEAYKDIARLPEPCMDERENVYKLTESYAEDEYVSGEFYYYDAARETWVQGIKDTNFLGNVTGTVKDVYNSDTLLGNGYGVTRVSQLNHIYGTTLSNFNNVYAGKKCRYLGADTDKFKFNKTYEYKLDITFSWVKDSTDGEHAGSLSSLPAASASHFGRCYWYDAGSCYYMCVATYNGYWEETEEAPYEVVVQMPEEPTDEMQIRYVKAPYGIPVVRAYYQCQSDVSSKGEYVYFYIAPTNTAGSENVDCLPVATENNVGAIYYYDGMVVGEFAKCDQIDGEYKWVSVPHPKVKRTVTIAEYIEKYRGIKLKQIIEIAAFKGKIAAVFITEEGQYKLYYDESIWALNNVTGEPGKKISIVGNRLIAGESGSYLRVADGVKSFTKTSSAIARSVTAGYALYGNGQEKSKDSYAYGSAGSGKATFVFYAQGGLGYGYKEVYEALSVKGTGFSVTFNGKTYYLTSESVTYQPNHNIYAWLVNSWHYDYADILTINASGVKEDFEWYLEENKFRPIEFTFKSTDAHYEDVVSWKKRLWGYSENTLYGTRSDIFGEGGKVDWLLGDNTYLEAISQPIWQGGDITGLAALSNALILLKEDSLTVFTGNYPAIMSGSTIPCRGLNAENRESVAVGNEAVFYLSQDGVYRFTGGIPQCISRDIKIKGTEAVGASDGNKYWLSLKEEDGNYALYVYDANLGIWHKEDNTHVSSFTMLGGEMYMADADTNEVYNICAPQEDVEWELELWLDEGTYKKKKYKEFIFRGNVGECELQLKADDGDWQAVRWTEDKLRVRIEPFICEELGIKLKGKGICEIKTLDRVYEEVER